MRKRNRAKVPKVPEVPRVLVLCTPRHPWHLRHLRHLITCYPSRVALEEYKKKRNFSKTPEPSGQAGEKKPASAPLFFCVQKHLASHLHYDFRLEWKGVLLSWAVPKGPSLNPADKRLAMHVEDHPIEYGTFEGVIPEGYGAGIVMLWDRGTWEPESDDVEAALKKGDLKFRLNGFKLKGSWVLVRTGGGYGGRAGQPGRSWLLIKHRDDWAGPSISPHSPRTASRRPTPISPTFSPLIIRRSGTATRRPRAETQVRCSIASFAKRWRSKRGMRQPRRCRRCQRCRRCGRQRRARSQRKRRQPRP